MSTAFFALVGYLAGSIPTGYWLVRLLRREDIRKVGSGNIGATNVWRTYGARYGVPVMLLDTLKGFVPALLATIYVGHLAGVIAGGAAMLGHWRPLFLKFARGGKVVATSGGAFLGVAPLVGGIAGRRLDRRLRGLPLRVGRVDLRRDLATRGGGGAP
jgi:acyl phosphate:glycerol-3-phosphate acyltransferase